jgi:hypothetical protein
MRALVQVTPAKEEGTFFPLFSWLCLPPPGLAAWAACSSVGVCSRVQQWLCSDDEYQNPETVLSTVHLCQHDTLLSY